VPLLLGLDRAESDQLVVGRHPRCDVVVGDSSVSRRHAQITFRDGVWVIQDLGSTNGTSVNGVPAGRVVLYAGDIVTLGEQSIQIN
jgi:pSer/pThr/pTyr-binding forkhead associated (FHA) protein